MNKSEFITRLANSLKHLPREDREDALTYYKEYFEEMGADDSLDVTQELGKPEDIAKEIIANCTEKHIDAQKEKGGIKNSALTIWMIVLAIFASPIAIPLAFSAIACLAAILISLISIVLAIACVSIASIVSGIALLIVAIPAPGFAQKLICIGLGLLLVGWGLLLLVATILFGELCIRGIAVLFKKLLIRKKVA